MVGFDPTIENLPRHYTKPSEPTNPTEAPFFAFPDHSLSLLDSLPEFDSIEDWIMDSDAVEAKREVEESCPDRPGSEKAGFWFAESRGGEGCGGNGEKGEDCVPKVEVWGDCENGSERGVGEGGNVGGGSIEDEMGKVSLVAGCDKLGESRMDGIGVQSECLRELESVETGEGMSVARSGVGVVAAEAMAGVGNGSREKDSDSSDSESESDSSSSSPLSAASSSSSSSDDEDEESENDEIEEGEIKDIVEMIGGSDEDDEGEPKGPIRSKNETEVLPPVPRVDVTLQPQHQTLPVGVILTIMGTKVIVEGSEKHNPLNEGSILWITESRLPLGLVDEIFGPVKNPYYVVRYNSDQEVPPGIHEGTAVSFVSEFAVHVINDKNIYQKGYDASGENDEELGDNVEFSDDEKEAEYRKAQKMAKKCSNNKKLGNQEFVEIKKFRGKGEFEKKNQPRAPPSMKATVQLPNGTNTHAQPTANQHPSVLAQPSPPNQQMGSSIISSMVQLRNVPNPLQMQTPTSSFSSVSTLPFAQVQTGSCSSAPLNLLPFNGMWTNGMPIPPQLQMPMPFPNLVPMNLMPYQQQNYQFPQPFSNSLPIQQPFELGQGILPNVCFPYMQPNFPQGPPASWPGIAFDQSQPQAVVERSQHGVSSNGPVDQSNEIQQSLNVQGNLSDDHQFSIGSNSGRGRGRRPNNRGGYFSRGRGRR
ncbi:hypothetical protein Sjap_000095 [Stephania japonica]|uniref:H/ACA ribonucleoprotein complex non-core subunit NAF1 n=1 Tax=Stephania japonica TaxID=461633 RepID=A0AAP0KIB8_9MAGN